MSQIKSPTTQLTTSAHQSQFKISQADMKNKVEIRKLIRIPLLYVWCPPCLPAMWGNTKFQSSNLFFFPLPVIQERWMPLHGSRRKDSRLYSYLPDLVWSQTIQTTTSSHNHHQDCHTRCPLLVQPFNAIGHVKMLVNWLMYFTCRNLKYGNRWL